MKDYTLTSRESDLFWAKVNKTDTCWNWTAGITKAGGYGQFTVKHETKMLYIAHRLSYTLLMGPIPDGMQLDHKCHNRRCVNPEHLRPVDHKTNQENHQGPTSLSKSGVRGVVRHPRTGRYRVQVRHDGRRYDGGYHATLAEAESAAILLRNELHTHNDRDRVAA